jgi:general stress protein 26
MADTKVSESEALKAFWDQLDDGSTVMLGLDAADQHTQPMTAFPEREAGLIWFFTRDDTDIARETATDIEARLILMSKDRKVFADVRGMLMLAHDKDRIDRYWNPMVAAWYPEGKDDPHLTLLRFVPDEGQVWVSEKGLVRLGFQIAKANLTKTKPNVGGSTDVHFRH